MVWADLLGDAWLFSDAHLDVALQRLEHVRQRLLNPIHIDRMRADIGQLSGSGMRQRGGETPNACG